MDATSHPTSEYQPTAADLAEMAEAFAHPAPTDEELAAMFAGAVADEAKA